MDSKGKARNAELYNVWGGEFNMSITEQIQATNFGSFWNVAEHKIKVGIKIVIKRV